MLYLPSIMPFAVMVLLNYLHSVPFTLEEAAVIDVCGRYPAFLPNMYYLEGKINYGVVCAAAFISLVLVLIIFIIFRKQFINSMIDGAIKG